MPGIGFVDKMYAKNRYLFLAYILSTKPIPGIVLYLAYILSTKPIPGIKVNLFCQSVKHDAFSAKK